MSRARGKFIVIEGLDGSGSSTQIKLLVERLNKLGKKTYATKEPTDNVVGGLVRGVLTGALQMPYDGLQLLFAADRAQHLSRYIIPMLESGANVVCDRYLWSSVAFGGVDVDREWLWQLQAKFLLPDLSIFLKVDPKICIQRIADNRFSVELFEKERKLREVWKNYEWLAGMYPEKIRVISGEEKVETVADRIWKAVKLAV